MARKKTAAERVREWRLREDVTLTDLSKQIGDKGGQLQRWESGERPTLPLRLKVALSQRTGIPLNAIVDPDEMRLARDLVAVMTRDAAA